jgi:golgi phosphoprotein 3
MATGGGLTRRRGVGGGGSSLADGGEEAGSSSSPTRSSILGETSFAAGEESHKIAYDPRDLSESAERNKQPKLTLMEEVLLIGLKDKQVRTVN